MKPTELFSAGVTEIKNRLPLGAAARFKRLTVDGQSGKKILGSCLSKYNCRVIPVAAVVMILATLITAFADGGITADGAAETAGTVLALVTAVFGIGFGFYFGGRYPYYYPYVFWGMYLLSYFIKITGCVTGAAGLIQTIIIMTVICAVPIFDIPVSLCYILSVPVYYTVLCLINGVAGYYPFAVISFALLAVLISVTVYSLFCSRMINSKKIRENNERIKLSAKMDAATGLYSREYGIDTAQAMISGNNGTALIVVDIDKFGEYNRIFGTAKADRTLQEIANCVKIVAKPYTDLACHFESDRILLCMEAQSDKEPVLLCEEIRSSIKTMNISFPANADFMTCTVTVGMARSTCGDSFDTVFEKAVRSLNTGKKAGGNCIAYKEHYFRPDNENR